MLKWLKRKLREWLLEEPAEETNVLEVLINGQLQTVRVVGIVGLNLLCQTQINGRTGETLVQYQHASDTARFWRIWERFQGETGQSVTWDDGTPFQPRKDL